MSDTIKITECSLKVKHGPVCEYRVIYVVLGIIVCNAVNSEECPYRSVETYEKRIEQ